MKQLLFSTIDDDDEEEMEETMSATHTALNAVPQTADLLGGALMQDLNLNPTTGQTKVAPALAFVALPVSAVDNVQVIDDPSLHNVAAQLRQLEDEVEAAEAAKIAEWKSVQGPISKKKIEELGKLIETLSARLDKEKGQGEAHVEALDSEIADAMELQDAVKRKYNFPFSRTTFGQGGVYMAFDDCRIEDVSGRFEVELLPAMGTNIGQISFHLRGVYQSRGHYPTSD